MPKRSKVFLMVLAGTVLIAGGVTFYLFRTGSFSSYAANGCPTDCPQKLSLSVTVNYNGKPYTKYPVTVTASSTNCNGTAAGLPICTRTCITSSGKCSVALCKASGGAPYTIKAGATFGNGIKLTTNSYLYVEYGGVPPVTLNAICKNSSNMTVTCPL